MTESFSRSQKFLGLRACQKTTEFTIVGIILRGIRRTDYYKLFAVLFDEFSQILAIKR